MLQGILQKISHFLVRIFFREIIIEGREHLPGSGPVLFTPNHPNALLDPLLLQLFSPPFTIRFVAKAPLFKIPIFGSILRSLGAIPVVRRIDVNQDVDYTAFFSACVEALYESDSIAIFPEGRSLPQPFLAPLRTGPARLFFMASAKNIPVIILPIGLNYERGYIFRSSVLISIAPAIETTEFETVNQTDPSTAIRKLTDEIAKRLDHHVFQAETYRDRELMLLLERVYSNENDQSWMQRLERLRVFESAMDDLRNTHPQQIDRLRHLLARYERLCKTFDIQPGSRHPSKRSFAAFLFGFVGAFLASAGWILNIIPYKLVDIIVRMMRKDESEAGTFKIAFGLLLFPLTWVFQGFLIYQTLGGIAALIYAALILPLTYFTLRFFEWREEIGAAQTGFWLGFGWSSKRRAEQQIEKLRSRIISEVDALANVLQNKT